MDLKDITQITYRRFFVKVTDYFLMQQGATDFAINYYIQCGQNVGNKLNAFYTLLINLRWDEQAIWETITRDTRTEIKAFTSNQEYEHAIQTGLSKKELLVFLHLFDQFAKTKNIRLAERERLMAYNKNKILAISWIRQNNEFLCINFYRLTRERATNLHSFNMTHTLKEKYSQSHLGRAHRALHWLDIVKFRSAGVAYYDFCGWYSGQEDKALLNINKFKEQFTQHKVKEYSGVIYKNKFLLFLKNLR